MALTRKKYQKKTLKAGEKSDAVVTSTVVTVRVSDEEKARLEEIMRNSDIKRYSDVMRMALHMATRHHHCTNTPCL
jgi:hypothetical protein